MALPIRFADNTTRDLAHATHREWLETNGLGGWSSSTLCMAHTRRYHGLLVVAQ
ncbi:MAG: glycogen debranching enzyme N-terminal domain-containing protein, partial [Candidatus Latescibacterota bacterium]|nr:glycogen debranching enzyme N-terminal domain-containing protein [Candidatus Latescibacterota bacterium]